MFPPLTTDVVGNDNVLDPSTNVVRESGSDSIIDIDVPEHIGGKGWFTEPVNCE